MSAEEFTDLLFSIARSSWTINSGKVTSVSCRKENITSQFMESFVWNDIQIPTYTFTKKANDDESNSNNTAPEIS